MLSPGPAQLETRKIPICCDPSEPPGRAPARSLKRRAGIIPASDQEAGSAPGLKNDQLFSMFSGRLDNVVRVDPGDLVRIYFVNVGPGTSAAHVIGSVFDRASAGGSC